MSKPVNEIKAVENEMSSFQKWHLTVEHCNALDVCRSMEQCKRKWDSLPEDYRRIKSCRVDQYRTASFGEDRRKELGLLEGSDLELYEAKDTYVKDASEADTDPDIDEKANGEDTDPDSDENGSGEDTDPDSDENDVSLDEKVETSKIQHSALETNGKALEKRPVENIKAEQSTATTEDEIEKMALDLQKNAELVNAVLEGKFPEDGDDDLKNVVVGDDVEFVRLQADKIIKYLGKISDTLAKLCDIYSAAK